MAEPSELPQAGAEVLTLSSRVPAWADGLMLIDYLARRFPYLDPDSWQREIGSGRLALDGARADGGTAVRRGQQLAYARQRAEPQVDRDFTVVHCEPSFAVVDKPAHLPVHGDGTFVRHTLVFLLGQRLGARVQLVHRLDRETSGLLVVARTPRAREQLEARFRAGTVGKSYLALVHGRVAADFVADGPIGRDRAAAVALRRAVTADGMPARTEVQLLRSTDRFSLVRCVPRTGRTHQIRVHLAAAGHPVAGDKLYGRTDADFLAFVRHVKAGGSARWSPDGGPDRQLLHAEGLSFHHPDDGSLLAFTAPMPGDMGAWAERLLPG